ncbi:MAG: ComEC/Rec2 family competence protein [Spirochaetaceae bacterium]|nr:ComEC/Rec2 family competence protein [Spirochaetaceae bacterium]
MVEVLKNLLFSLKKNTVCLSAICVAFLLYSGIVPVCSRNPYKGIISPKNVTTLRGKVISNPVKTAKGAYYRCKMDLESVTGDILTSAGTNLVGIQSTAKGEVFVYLPAQVVEIHYPGRLYSASSSANTGILVETGANLLLKARFAQNNSTTSVNETFVPPQFFATEVKFLGFDEDLFGKIAFFRALCRLQLKRLLYAWGDSGGLFLALVSGSGEYTDSNLAENFRNSGLAHILALSGMHLSFFAGLASTFSKFLGRNFSKLFSLNAVLLFVWFAGLTPSLLRALLCCLLGFITSIIGLKPSNLRILCISFLIHICIVPSDLFQLSFQLSYLALLGILLISPLLEVVTYNIMPPYFASGISSSAGAQVLSTPVSAKVFGYFMPGGIVASVIVSPIVSLFLSVGVLCVLFSLLCPLMIEPLGVIMNLLYNCINFSVHFFSKIPVLEL